VTGAVLTIADRWSEMTGTLTDSTGKPALDYAIARIFRQAKQRNEIVRTVRGVLLTLLLVAFPIMVVFAGSVVQALLDLIPDANTRTGIANLVVRLAAPVATFALFVVATVMVYRNVPAENVPASAWRRPALVVGLLLAAFTQVFAFIAPLMTRISALYGAIVAVFALLAWLSIGFNMLLIGAAWTRAGRGGLIARCAAGRRVRPRPRRERGAAP
jgi:uncharacterized BrkB/YihY/UPF0761 family membrane protein